MTEKLTAHARSTGRVWEVSVEGIDATTLVKSPANAPAMAAELAAMHRGGSASDYEVDVQVTLREDYQQQWDQVQTHKRQAAEHRQAWRRAAHELVTAMRQDGLSQSEVAAALGVGVQTVRTWEQFDQDARSED